LTSGRLRTAPLALLLAAALASGCPEWLEVDDTPADDEGPVDDLALLQSHLGPVELPSAPAEVGGQGPIVPATPGLRVPAAGYWTRARLDVADMLLPYTWASLLRGEDHITLRLEAVRRGEDEAGPLLPWLHAVIPIALPRGTDQSQLDHLDLGHEALASATASIQTTHDDTWLLELTHLRIDHVDDKRVTGTLEGVARRGARGRRERRFAAGFVALRAPTITSLTPRRR